MPGSAAQAGEAAPRTREASVGGCPLSQATLFSVGHALEALASAEFPLRVVCYILAGEGTA